MERTPAPTFEPPVQWEVLDPLLFQTTWAIAITRESIMNQQKLSPRLVDALETTEHHSRKIKIHRRHATDFTHFREPADCEVHVQITSCF